MTTEQIAKEIQSLIESEVRKQTPDTKWKEHYQNIMQDLTHELGQAEAAVQEFKEDNLPINAIEAEGYRRCLQHMIDRFNRWTDFEELD
jgi:squalene cyclase